MIDNRLEYQRMYKVERKLWWYRILQGKVLKQIKLHFAREDKGISILDAACGTGGLMSFLKEAGYLNVCGFDYSQHALEFARQRELDVSFGDLKDPASFQPDGKFDLICCNDALYFLDDREIIAALMSFRQKLNGNGLIIINIHAFEAFAGMHDLAVGSSRRFTLPDFVRYAAQAGLQVSFKTYWPFFLSLPIWLVRAWQRYRMRKYSINSTKHDSDVSYPGDLLNALLLATVRFEEAIFPSAPFGSSLFIVLK